MNQIKISIRNFKHSPMLLFVNLPGLAIGLAAFLLLMVYIKHETSFDQHIENKDRVIRLYNKIIEENSVETYGICMRKAYSEVPAEIPGIEKTTQIYRGWYQNILRGEDRFNNKEMYYVDKEFFDVFGFKLLSGNNNDALGQKGRLVLTETLAQHIFGSIECVGEVVEIDEEEYIIGGVIEDMPINSHLQFDVLCSMETINPDLDFGGLEFFTYYLLKENANEKEVSNKISTLNDIKVNELFSTFNAECISGTEPLSDIHLHTKVDWDLSRKGSMESILLIGFLAAFILLIAIINFINLYIFHGEKRLLEIGMRKSFGATLLSLRKLFYLETALLSLIALTFAILLTMVTLPYFSDLIQVELNILQILTPQSIIGIILFIILLVFVSGSYPAHYLSKLSVIDAVKGGEKSLKRKKYLTVSSVLLQFFISIFLIVSLLVVNAQINYMKSIPLGFDAEKVIAVRGFNQRLGEKAQSISEELKKLTFVQSVGTSVHGMGAGYSGQVVYKYGESEESGKSLNEYRVMTGFCETLELELLSGRFFRDNNEDKMGIILNQKAVEMLGYDNPIGQFLMMHGDEPLKVIGVVKDFYYDDNAGQEIQPLCLTAYANNVNNFYLKLIGDFNDEKKADLEEVFIKFLPDYKMNARTVKSIYDYKFQSEERLFNLILSGAILAIFLSFIGMFALSVFNVQKRSKEIGLRKVHGSTSLQVLLKILADILIWVVWAMIPAFLVAIITMRFALSHFANRISLSPIYFILGGMIAILIASIAISFKSIKAATQNPVDSLRYE